MTSYDPGNVFARILRGELPCEKIYEDAHSFAFMDIMPRADGHALVIPKHPARTFLDLPQEEIGPLYGTVQLVARAARQAFAADGLTIQQFNESAGGQVVFHMHVHVLPRREGAALLPPTTAMAAKEVLAAHGAKLREAIASLAGPR